MRGAGEGRPSGSPSLLCLRLMSLLSSCSLPSLARLSFSSSPVLSPALAPRPISPLSAARVLPGPMRPLCSGSLQGGTDLEKHRDLLVAENERLRQEMRRFEAELQELRAKPAAPCTGCEHSQVSRLAWPQLLLQGWVPSGEPGSSP